jgi:CubicO group peptidase (beta-lactamase class C family)
MAWSLRCLTPATRLPGWYDLIITEKFVLLNFPKRESHLARKAVLELYGGLRGRGAGAGWDDAFIQEVRPRIQRRRRQQSRSPAAIPFSYHELPEAHAGKPAVMVMRDPFKQLIASFKRGLWARHPPLPAERIKAAFPQFPEMSFTDFWNFQHTLYLQHLLGGAQPTANIGPQSLEMLMHLAAKPGEIVASISDDYIDSGRYLDDIPPITFLRQEHLTRELHDYLLDLGYPAERLAFILEMESESVPLGQEQLGDIDTYFTPALKRQFRYRERALFELFYNYTSPLTRGPAAPLVIERQNFGRLVRRAISRLVDPAGRPGKSPGMVVGVVTEEGSDVFGFGTTRLGEDTLPRGDTLFGIGSLTKVFTGLLLAKAVTEGRVSLDESVFKILSGSIPLDPEITLRHLVSHTAGLPLLPENLPEFQEDGDEELVEQLAASPAANYNREMLISFIEGERDKPAAGPGADISYSSLGCGILSMALEEKFGYFCFEDLNKAWITDVLGLSDTGTLTPRLDGLAAERKAQGYSSNGSTLRPVGFSDMGILAGAGALISTANDMNHLLEALIGIRETPLDDAIREASRPLVSAGDAGEMTYAVRASPTPDGGRMYSKGGLVPGYASLMVWRTSPRLGLVMMANHGAVDSRFSVPGFNRVGAKLFEVLCRGV